MSFAASALGVLIAMLGVLGIARPRALIGLVEAVWRPHWGPYVVAAVRLLIGAVLLLAAPQSRYPTTLGVLAVLAIVGGLAVPVMSRERQLTMLAWWKQRHDTFLRAWSLAAVAFGAFVTHACL